MDDASQLITSTFVFRFAVPCFQLTSWPVQTKSLEMPAGYQIPSFGQLDNRPVFADLRLGWHPKGLAFSLAVTGKKRKTVCSPSSWESSDGLALLIDTRPSGDIHRASRFCHQFGFLPGGIRSRSTAPTAKLLKITRAREEPKQVPHGTLTVESEKRPDGYVMRGAIPAEALTGYDAEESRRLGFFYVVRDRELGWQSFSISEEFPVMSDPSLWGILELDRGSG